jgi:oligopeptidase B
VTLIELPDPASTTVWVSASGYSMPETVFVRPLCDSDAPWVRVHQDSVPAGLDLSVYESGWDTATSADGTTVPLSWVRRPGVPVTGVLLYGYGAYGLDYPPELAVSWLAMADRGVVCVNANVRGGGELGTSWHDAGRLERKPRSFEDFLACAARSRELFGTDKVVAWGGSAGGLLVAASLNADPAAFAGVVAEVPFVDCLATMSDPTLPLVVADYVEWGNPADPVIRDVIASYTPVRNVRAAAYPPVLAVCGLHDPRVSYWEPATWVQVLRAGSTSGAPALLRVEDGGHSGAASLAVSCAQRAQKVAFALACLTGVLPQA